MGTLICTKKKKKEKWFRKDLLTNRLWNCRLAEKR